MKKISLFFMVIMLSMLAACGEPEPIRVGFVGTLSGRRSEIGVSARNAAILRVDQLNNAGGIHGRPVELIIRDNQGDVELCETILNEMIADGIQFIVGPLFSQMAETSLKAIEGKSVLLMSPTMSTDFLSKRDDNLVRTCSTTSMQAIQLADVAHAQGLESIAAVYDLSNRKYTELLYKSYVERAKTYGMSVPLALTIDKTQHPEMLPLARKIVAANLDGVLMCLSAVDAASLSQQIRKLGSDIQLYGVSWSQTDDLIIHGGKAVEGMILIAFKSYTDPRPEFLVFEKAYKARYKKAPSFVSGMTIDALDLLFRGMEKDDQLEPASVKKIVINMEPFQGLSTKVKLDEFGDSQAQYWLTTVKDGKYVNVD